jgi:hypothetical protein
MPKPKKQTEPRPKGKKGPQFKSRHRNVPITIRCYPEHKEQIQTQIKKIRSLLESGDSLAESFAYFVAELDRNVQERRAKALENVSSPTDREAYLGATL